MRYLLALLIAALPAAAAAKDCPDDQRTSGLPVPRFVSLQKDKVFMRSGPGDTYPVIWVYGRKGLPVEIIKEYCIWRLTRDPAGTSGWIKKSMLDGQRTAYVTRSVRTLYARPDTAAPPVWRAEPGVIANIVLCEAAWCSVNVGGRSGYILRNQIWGVYPREVIED